MKTLALLVTLTLSSPPIFAGEIYKLSDQHLGDDSPWTGKDLALRLVPGEDGKDLRARNATRPRARKDRNRHPAACRSM